MLRKSLFRGRRCRSLLMMVFASTLLAPLFTVAAATPGRAEAASASSLAQYRQWINEARAMYPYRESADKMYRTMLCESSGNPGVRSPSGSYQGLFQYATATWRGGWNPYRNNSLWDARSQIFATAKAWSIGMQGQWSCYFMTPGR